MRRRRKGVLVLAFAAAVFFLVNWLLSLFGGGATPIDTDRGTVQPSPEEIVPPEADPPGVEPEAGPSIEGFLRDGGGRGVPGARVLIVTIREGVRGEIRLETDRDGRFVDDVSRHGDVVFLEVVASGYPPIRRRFEDAPLVPGKTFRLDLTAPSTFDLAGHVKTFGGPAIVGAKVRFRDWEAITDAEGRFRIGEIGVAALRLDPRPPLVVTHADHRKAEVVLDLDGRNANLEDIEVVMEQR